MIARAKAAFLRCQEALLCLVRKWWRPITQIGLCASVWANLVYLPLKKGEPPSLAEAAAYVTAIVAAFGVRAYEKIKGAAE